MLLVNREGEKNVLKRKRRFSLSSETMGARPDPRVG
jgi:hypothetical protein